MHSTSGNNDGKNWNITILHIFEECQKKRKVLLNINSRKKKEMALEENGSGTDGFDSSSNLPAMADEIDDRAAFLVGRTSRFVRLIRLSNKLLAIMHSVVNFVLIKVNEHLTTY